MTHLADPQFYVDLRSDILWRGADGSVAIWNVDGATVTSSALVTSFLGGEVVKPDINFWTIAGTGDFNRFGASDGILWRGADGSVAIWDIFQAAVGPTLLNGALVTLPGGEVVKPDINFWTVAGTGHFDNDALSDILWRGADGSVAIWNVDGATVTSSALVTLPGGEVVKPGDFWTIAGTGDFYPSERSNDILWRGADGSVAVWNVDGATVTSSALVTLPGGEVANPGDFWTIAGTGDFNGDDHSDILWRGADGSVAIWNVDGATLTGSALVTLPGGEVVKPDINFWTIAGTGDFNGDDHSDILWRGADGSVAIWNVDGATVTSSALVTLPGGAVANPGDFWTIVPSEPHWILSLIP